ncbi:sensor histidine kinase [Candidatus Poriferisodalis sp.]|uniref:sensor histidine kinase n=1 Tax=Candidatus Poriferisodalis sp. TaxID=3101277 RepID=UPI003B02742F
MNLRQRLYAAMFGLLALIAIGGIIVVRSQRSYLIEQVDQQLDGALPYTNAEMIPGEGIQIEAIPADPFAPISTLFVGLIADGQLLPFLQGQLNNDTPDIPSVMAELIEPGSSAMNVDGVEERVRFRVRAAPTGERGAFLVAALPLDEVENAVRRLELVLLVVGGLVVAVMSAAVWWVERLGIRPLRTVTHVAETISGGDRSLRVQQTDSRTEAGKLANAFNVMLDDRDAIELRRRQFVADASHELRTPLTSIRGYLDLYAHGRFSSPEHLDDMMRRIGRDAKRMKDLVEDLLLLADLDQQRPLRKDRVDLNRLVSDAANDARAVQPERSILLSTPDPEVTATGDEFRLQQVVAALVDNALTHTEVSCELRLAARATPTGPTLVVADDGPGLDSARANRIFDRFFRGDQSRSRATGGSGLGLAIARSIVDAHGGTIDLRTAPGAGCTFTIWLPAGRAGAEQAGDTV